MRKRRILVTGATGKTGAVVTAELLKSGHPVRAMVHREDGRSATLKALGAEVVVADMCDVARVSEALRDVQGAYYCPPFGPFMIQGAVAFAVAARQARLEHIVGMTQWLASPSHPALMTRQHWLVDKLFAMLPEIAHTIVRPGFFADAYMEVLGVSANLGLFPWPYGNSRNAPPSNEDIGRVVAAALMDPDRHAGKVYRPTGPKLLGAGEMAETFGRVLGRKVRVLPAPDWLFLKSARLVVGLPVATLSGMRYYIEDHRRGAFELAAPTSDVLDVTGRQPEDFETITRRYAALPRNQSSFLDWLRHASLFAIAPFSTGLNLKKYDREVRGPMAMDPQFAVDSVVWRYEHYVARPNGDASNDAVSPGRPLAQYGDSR